MGFFQEIRQFAHRYDPIGANLVDNMIRTDSRVVAEVSRGADRVLGGDDKSTAMGRLTRDESRRNVEDPARAISRAAATVALMYGFGSLAGAGTGTAAGTASGTGAGAGTAASGYAGTSSMAGFGGTYMPVGQTLGNAALGGSAVAEGAVGYGFSSGVADAALAAGAGAGYATGAEGGTEVAPSESPGTQKSQAPSPDKGAPWWGTAMKSVATGVGTNVATSLLMPKPKQPAIEPVVAMPDPEEEARARRRKAAMKKSRQGRTASILTDAG
jgi:hypothetical protein